MASLIFKQMLVKCPIKTELNVTARGGNKYLKKVRNLLDYS
jgi:hypothetical protein